jgi:hypothetical protein
MAIFDIFFFVRTLRLRCGTNAGLLLSLDLLRIYPAAFIMDTPALIRA